MTQEVRPGVLRSALVWSGVGLVAGALLWLVVVAVVYDGGLSFDEGGWWVLLPALVAVLALALAVGPLPADAGDTTTARYYLFRLCPLTGIGLLTAVLTFPRDSFEATTSGPWAYAPSPTLVHLWLVTCAIGLGCALMLVALRRPEPRPFRRTVPAVGAGVTAVALTGVLVTAFLVPWVPQQAADDLPGPAPLPPGAERVGWEWRPPMDTEVTDVLPGSHGPLVLLRDGAVALDGTDGEELWSYRRPYDRVGDVWVDEGHVHVRYRFGTDESGEERFETVVLDAGTGEIADEYPDAVGPPSAGWMNEHGRELVDEQLDLPQECVVSEARGYGHLLVGVFGCLEDADAQTVERSIETADPFGWEHTGARTTVVAVDPLEETELWHTEWTTPAGARTPRLNEAPTASTDQQPIIVDNGPEASTLVLDPQTGSELVTLPDEADSDGFRGVAHADARGSVLAFDSGDMEITFHRADASGEITDAAVLTGTFLDDLVGSPRIAVLDDALVIVRTLVLEDADLEVTVQVAPFGQETALEEGIVLETERKGTSLTSSEPSIVTVPGASVLLSEDDRSQVLEGLVP